jgi:hypothetical protein
MRLLGCFGNGEPPIGPMDGMSLDAEAVARRIVELQVEHRDLDDAISRLCLQPGVDELQLRRLKKRKLQIKDMLVQLQMQLVPDILA